MKKPLLQLAAFAFLLASVTLTEQQKQEGETLLRTLDAIDTALDFYYDVHRDLNLDAVIGTRLVEGQLTVLLKHIHTGDTMSLPEKVVERIRLIKNKARRVSDLAIPIIRNSQPQYYARIGPINEEGLWQLDYASRDLDTGLIIPSSVQGEMMHEEDSDDCLTELFGTGQTPGRTCMISRQCWRRMTSPGYRGYSLSHEVFYLEIAEMTGCLRPNMLAVADALNSGFCANMFDEAVSIAAEGFPEDRRDLFMEIPALCGILGYRQFFRQDWLDQMLSWQRLPRGCWGMGRQERQTGEHGRFKREERLLSDGCQCHRTAVALGALVQYVRYNLEYLGNTVDNTVQ